MREIGVSDVGVPKKMHKLAGAFSGRGVAYAKAAQEEKDAGPDAKNAQLADALARNVLAGQGDGAAFADYYRRAETLLAATALETFLRGEAPFPRRELGPLNKE